jgi:hypothetical protein
MVMLALPGCRVRLKNEEKADIAAARALVQQAS